jgi:MFS family permease
MTLLGMAPAHTLGAYAPLLVISFGFDRLKSNAMLSIGAWALLVTNLLWGYLAAKTGQRGLMVFVGVLLLWGFMVCRSRLCWALGE